MASIKDIRRSTFKLTSIKSAFRTTGIHPFNPEVVLIKLREEREAQQALNPLSSPPLSTPPSSILAPFATPMSVRSLERSAKRIRIGFNKGKLVQGLVASFVKGALIQAYTGAQATSDLFEQQAA